MANDALVASLAAGLQMAERHIRDLQDIIDGIDRREQRTTALVVSVQQRVEIAEARIRATAQLARLAAQPEDQAAEVGASHHSHAKLRDRHGMHIVRGLAFAPLGAGLRWVVRSNAHKVITAAAGLSVAAAATVSAPVIAGAPAVPHPHAIVRAHHHRRRTGPHSMEPPVPAGLPAAAPVAVHHHHHADSDDGPAPTPEPSPSPTDSATPTPAPSASGTGIPSPGTSPPGG